jgi:hypothetical protein
MTKSETGSTNATSCCRLSLEVADQPFDKLGHRIPIKLITRAGTEDAHSTHPFRQRPPQLSAVYVGTEAGAFIADAAVAGHL